MLKYITIAFLLLPLPSPEPRAGNSNYNQRNDAPQLAASPLNSPNAQAPDTSTQTTSGKSPESDRQADIAKAAQATNDRIARATLVIAIFGALSFLATCGYIVAAFLQWGRAREQAKKAGEQVIKMQSTLEAIQNQGKTLRRQAIGTTSQARFTRDALVETRKMAEKNAEVVDIMKKQLAHTEAINNAQVNFAVIEGNIAERSARATEASVEVTRQNMIYAQRAYVNVVGGRMLGANEDGFKIVIKNSGHTPANNVQINYVVDVGNLPPGLPSDSNWEAAGVIAPDGTYDIGAHAKRVFTSEEQNLRQRVEEKFYVWCVGVISYNDIFQASLTDEPRITRFCVFGEWSNPLFRAWILGNDAN
ncbi:MAG: hypothetical protein QOH41_4297 [Blastocatellia bacterium]|jgi:hypothetical protein|nr:hypothetical protein [Blastocatellia bacterium]